MRRTADVPLWIWAGLPLASLIILWLSPLVQTVDQWRLFIFSDKAGLIENVAVLCLLIAAVAGVRVILRGRAMGLAMRVVVGILVAGSILLAGEECSWGQHWLGFRTPGGLAAINRQGEFNMHNIKGGFQEYMTTQARHSLNWICLLGGVILPLVLHRWRQHPSIKGRFWDYFVPTLSLIPLASMIPLAKNFAHNVEKIFRPASGSYADLAFVHPAGEVKEMFFAMLLMAYMLSLSARLQAPLPCPPPSGQAVGTSAPGSSG